MPDDTSTAKRILIGGGPLPSEDAKANELRSRLARVEQERIERIERLRIEIRPDYKKWGRVPAFTIDETLCLILGINPDPIAWKASRVVENTMSSLLESAGILVRPEEQRDASYEHPYLALMERLHLIVNRAIESGQIQAYFRKISNIR